MAAPAGHPRTRCECLGATIIDIEGLRLFDHSQRRATAGAAMADIAGCLGLGTECAAAMMAAHPGLADCMHTMGTTVDGSGHGRMADRTLTDRCGVTLGINSAQVVIHLVPVGAGFVSELGMGRIMAGLALHTPVTGAVAEQALTRHRHIRIRGEARISPGLERAVGIDGHGLPQAVMMAGLTGGHVIPAASGIAAYCRHRTMTGLALHVMLTGCIYRIAHGAPQTLGVLARMAVVAGVAGSDTVQGHGRSRQLGVGMAVMHGRCHIGNTGLTTDPPHCQGVAVVTAVTHYRLAIGCRGLHAGTVSFLGEQTGVVDIAFILLIMQTQDIHPPILFGTGGQIYPTGSGLGGTAAGIAGMAVIAVNFAGYRQHGVAAGDRLTIAVDGINLDHRKIVETLVVIKRGNGNARGLKPFKIIVPGQRGRLQRGHWIAGEADVGTQVGAEQGLSVVPEVGLILTGAIDRAGGVGRGLIGQGIVRIQGVDQGTVDH